MKLHLLLFISAFALVGCLTPRGTADVRWAGRYSYSNTAGEWVLDLSPDGTFEEVFVRGWDPRTAAPVSDAGSWQANGSELTLSGAKATRHLTLSAASGR